MNQNLFQEHVVDILANALEERRIPPDRASDFARRVLDMGEQDRITADMIKAIFDDFPEMKNELFQLMKDVDTSHSAFKINEIKSRMRTYAEQDKS